MNKFYIGLYSFVPGTNINHLQFFNTRFTVFNILLPIAEGKLFWKEV